ncbi:radical SAM protein [Massilia sp. Root335]|uniref:radical SAM/SPASM domain-containing protein n=1 Tax=Massilia sp. Root335 TaxID=1736517 RepID=UPI001E5729E6|nr:radical SAM protein [Massilia sp. Root335]
MTAPARILARRSMRDSRPRSRQLHLLEHAGGAQLLVANGSRLYRLAPAQGDAFRAALDGMDEGAIAALIASSGLDAPLAIDDTPLAPMAPHALSLAIAQKCNLGCTYCYAQQGSFGGTATAMSEEVARQAVDRLLESALPGSRVNLAFMGGEPLTNRAVLRAATAYAAGGAAARQVDIGFSITTNGTLLRPDDADFFEQHGFAVTVSLDGLPEQHDRLRPFKSGKGSFDRIMERVAPLLAIQRRAQVSARVTVTPFNLQLVDSLDYFVAAGFHSVGFSPLLRAPNGEDELGPERMEDMLEGMIACGLAFEERVLRGERYPFLNMVNALRELQRGTHRPYPCGAGAGYFGVSASGDVSACHRFVGDAEGQFGTLADGIDRGRQAIWLAQRHVHAQQPCSNCWARYLCGGGCHHEVLARGRTACDYIRGWLHYTMQAHDRLSRLAPDWAAGAHGD